MVSTLESTIEERKSPTIRKRSRPLVSFSDFSSQSGSFTGFISDTVKPQIAPDEADLHNLALQADFLLSQNDENTDSITEI